jgi:RNA polymerase sigma-70 factor (ECF subfamily)
VRNREMEWADWMRGGLAGDEASYRRLLEAVAPALRGIVRGAASRFRLPAADIEDIVQETLLAVHLKRHTWRETEPLTPWLRAIARNKLIDALRRRGRGGRVDVPIDGFAETLPAPEPEPQLSPEETSRALSAINGRQRDVVRAIAVDGLTAAETAARLGMNEGAVRVALHRGLAAIAAAFRTEET